jgi:hypothetical protein
MRSVPVCLLLSATVLAIFAVVPMAADAGSSSMAAVGPLKLCTYNAGDPSEGSQALFVKVLAARGGGVRGTLRIAGTGLDRTIRFRLKKGGIGLVAIPVTPPMTLTLTTRLILRPANPTRTDHVAVTSADPNTPAPRGCVAH